jgi:hypothetical protein
MRLPSMPAEEERRARQHFDRHQPRLELLGSVLDEARPVDAPGISSLSAVIIWQPLQIPSAKVSGRAKNEANSSRARAL